MKGFGQLLLEMLREIKDQIEFHDIYQIRTALVFI